MKTFLNYIKPRLSKYQKHFLSLVVALLLIILFQLIVAPIKKYSNWKGEESTYVAGESIDSLQKLLAYKQALLKASKEDSIYLVISIPDSLVSIYIKGVNIFSTKVSKYDESAFLSGLNAPIYQKQFGDLQKAQLLKSTIIKEPIKVKMAPKNALEAATMASIPDSLSFEPAFISYELQNGTIVNLMAEDEYFLSVKIRFLNIIKGISSLANGSGHFRIEEFNPSVSIRVDNVDLSSIYRALPNEPYLIVRL